MLRNRYDRLAVSIVWQLLRRPGTVTHFAFDPGAMALVVRRRSDGSELTSEVAPGRYRIVETAGDLVIKERQLKGCEPGDYRVHNCAPFAITVSLAVGGKPALASAVVARGQTAYLRVDGCLYFALVHGAREGRRLNASVKGLPAPIRMGGVRKCVVTLSGTADAGYTFRRFVDLGSDCPNNQENE